ncbi:MAG: putative transposase [Patescibacteria group bacterium]
MRWRVGDESTERMAVVQLNELGLVTQEELAEAFTMHVKSVTNYVAAFRREGGRGLSIQNSGPKQSWKVMPDVRAKILVTALKGRVVGYAEIQKHLKEQWNQEISVASIRQVLLDNGFIEERIRGLVEQGDLFEPGKKHFSDPDEMTLFEIFDGLDKVAAQSLENVTREKSGDGANSDQSVGAAQEQEEEGFRGADAQRVKRSRQHYSQAGRIYLDGLERGIFSAYAGGLLFAPLIERHHFVETIQKVIDVPTHEGYSLRQFCLAFFYFDIFEFRSIEDFKTVYPEEYGILIGRNVSPSIYTSRRFLHRVRELKKGDALIEAFAKEYLKSGLVQWGVFYIDGHFLPYYGMRVITMGWHGVREKALKGSYQFLAVDERFNPFLFLLTPSSEDLLEKIPEMIEAGRRLGREVGIQVEDMTVIFDREGYSAELFRKLDAMEPKVKFITWAKYKDRWVWDYKEDQFDKSVMVQYEIRERREIKYFETEREMNKYGKVRCLVTQRAGIKERGAIYTNDKDADGGRIVQLMCRRWGQETMNKTFKWDHKMDYFPGYVAEDLEEQPLVDNPRVKELKRERASLTAKLNGLRIQFAQKAFAQVEAGLNMKEMKEKYPELCGEMDSLHAQITLLNLEMEKFPKEVRFDEAHDGKHLVELDYEKKRFMDCIKAFTYMMEKEMCSVLSKYYDDPKDIYVILSMIVRRGGAIKLENGRLRVRLKGFRNPGVDFAARHLCEELNQMGPRTLDKYRFPIRYEVA